MPIINVLVFPAGEQNSIEIHDALCSCVNIKLFGASSSGLERHGPYLFRNFISGLPLITENLFMERLNEIIKEYNIDVIFPTHDTITVYLTDHAELIHAKIVASDKETATICRDKKMTYDTLKGYNFLPEIYNKITNFPVFIKPRKGQGAVGTKLIKTIEQIPNDIDLDEYLVCEYLPGEEYSVDCFTDRHGNLLFISPRSRQRLIAGISAAGRIEILTAEIKNIASVINSKLHFCGLWYFQIKKDDSERFKLLEISTRTAGGMCLTRARGVNFPLLSVYTTMGNDIEIKQNSYTVIMDRALISRYKIDYDYNTVYLDFDDTLIIREEVNLNLIHFLYQCKNKNKTVILLTRHEGDIYQSLKKYAIDIGLFSKINKLKITDIKSQFITERHAIFIDNAFKERKNVHDNCNIPVFDVDTVEVLLDWSC